MPGRKPVPAEHKELHGTANVTRERERKEALKRAPKPSLASAADAPEHLNEPAKNEWSRLLREFAALGLVTQIDLGLFAGYCTAYGRWVEAEAKVKELGTIVKTAAGNLIQNPYLAVANRALEQMQKLGAAGYGDAVPPKTADAPVMAGQDFDTFIENNPQALN
jgi:P27 family predicted phage terminase small subunit